MSKVTGYILPWDTTSSFFASFFDRDSSLSLFTTSFLGDFAVCLSRFCSSIPFFAPTAVSLYTLLGDNLAEV